MNETNLDRYQGTYASRIGGMRSSVMRDLMAVIARPEVISLAGGLPETGAFEPGVLEQVMGEVCSVDSASALQYGPTEGRDEMREVIREVMAREEMHVDASRIVVTAGGQQVLDLVARIFIDPGDVVLAEGPTYPGAIPVFLSYQADVRHLPLDADGLDPDRVAHAIAQLRSEGRRAKYLYTIPTFHNPGGVSMSLERREALVELARREDLVVLEDNPYSLLRFSGDPLPTLRSMDDSDTVLYLGTFSKIFAPGIRLGWLEAPPAIGAKVNLAKQAADLCSSTMSQHIVERFFRDHDWGSYVERLAGVYRSRRDAMVEAIGHHFPAGTTFNEPQGGLFIWATLPAVIDTGDLLARALQEQVAFVPGANAFVTPGLGTSSMRLNYSAVDEETITEGVARLGRVAHEALELARQLGLDQDEAGR